MVLEIVQYLLDVKREKHAIWSHFHSAPWPPSFFTAFPESDPNAPVSGQGLVIFTIDCRTSAHAQSLLTGLREHLRKLYEGAGTANFSVFIHKGERQDWSSF